MLLQFAADNQLIRTWQLGGCLAKLPNNTMFGNFVLPNKHKPLPGT